MKLKKWLSLAMSAIMLVSLLPVNAFAEEKKLVTKEAKWKNAETGLAEITMTAKGEESVSPVDVVLVVDNSGSMNTFLKNKPSDKDAKVGDIYCEDANYVYKCTKEATKEWNDWWGWIDIPPQWEWVKAQRGIVPNGRIVDAQNATDSIIDTILNAHPNNRVALVPFADEVRGAIPLKGKNEIQRLKDGVNNMYAYWGTSYYEGLNQAEKFFKSKNSNAKQYIIFISDGKPTSGQEGTIKAKALRDSGITIHTVGLNLGGNSDAETALRNISSEKNGQKLYANVSDTEEDLPKVLEQIAGDTQVSATSGVVMDYIAPEFEVVTNPLPTGAELTTESGRQVVTWNIGEITATPKTLTFQVKLKNASLKDGKAVGGTYYTNDNSKTKLTYTDKDGKPDQKQDVTVNPLKVNYYVSFEIIDRISGVANPAGQRATDGGKVTEPTVSGIPNGYTLDGWYTTKNPDGTLTGQFSFGSTGTSVTSNTTLYAKLVKNNATVTFTTDGNGTIEEGKESATVAYNDKLTESQVPNTIPEEGYEFDVWKKNDTPVSDLLNEIITENVTYRATFKPIPKFTVTFETDGNGSISGDTTRNVYDGDRLGALPGTTPNPGYTFVGWSDGVTADTVITGSKTYIATFEKITGEWIDITYQIHETLAPDAATLDGKGKSEPIKYNLWAKNIALTPPAPAGDTRYWVFDGWYNGDDEVTDWTAEKPTSDTTYTAKWTQKYDVVYNLAGGSPAIDGVLPTAAGETVTVVDTIPTQDGYRFIGWKYNNTDTIYQSGNTFTMPAETVTLTAQWKEEYTVSFDLDGGNIDEKTSVDPQTGIDGESATIPSDPSKGGFRFMGWKEMSVPDNQEEIIIPPGATTISYTRDVEFTAQWAKLYTVKFDLNGGNELELKDITQIEGKDIVLHSENPIRTDYEFTGWQEISISEPTEPADLIPLTAAGATVSMPARDVTLTAQWEWAPTTPWNYTVQYFQDGDHITDKDEAKTISQEERLATGEDGNAVTIPGITANTPVGSYLEEVVYVYTDLREVAGDASKVLITENNQIVKVKYATNQLNVWHKYGSADPVYDADQSINTVRNDEVVGNVTINVKTKTQGRYTRITGVTVDGVAQPRKSDGTIDVTYLVADKIQNKEVIFTYATRSSSDDDEPTNPGGGGGGGSSSGGGGSSSTAPETVEILDEEVPLADGLEADDHFAYVMGYEDKTVRPQNLISREEATAIFYRLLKDGVRDQLFTNAQNFPDVASGRWSNNSIATMANGKIVVGYPDGAFKPASSITRAEFAVIVTKFDNLDYSGEDMFNDINGHWAAKYINAAAKKGWIHGYPEGDFRPDAPITRAEAMSLINNVLNRKVAKEGLLPDATYWIDNPEDAWYYEDVMEATNSHDYTRESIASPETWTQMKENKTWR